MADPKTQVRAALVAAPAVTAIVGSRISPLVKPQSITLPAVTLQTISLTAENHLRGYAGLDSSLVQVDSWATTYDSARDLADKCRTALAAESRLLSSEFEEYDDATDSFRIAQTWQVWV